MAGNRICVQKASFTEVPTRFPIIRQYLEIINEFVRQFHLVFVFT